MVATNRALAPGARSTCFVAPVVVAPVVVVLGAVAPETGGRVGARIRESLPTTSAVRLGRAISALIAVTPARALPRCQT